MKITKSNKHSLLIGIIEDLNLEKLIAKKKFSVPVNGSVEKAYRKLYGCSKSEKANIAVIEGRNVGSVNGTFYSTSGNPFCTVDLIKGNCSLYSPGRGYAVLNHPFP